MALLEVARRAKHRLYRSTLPWQRRWYELTEPVIQGWHRLFPYHYSPADFGSLFVARHTEPFAPGGVFAPVPRVIYVFWTGDNEMPDVRRRNLERIVAVNPHVDVRLVTAANLQEHLVPGQPVHPAFEHLSFIHRSDYLRCYMMNFHGGGYADIKAHRNDWSPAFDRLDASDAWVLGYRNPVRWMTPNFTDPRLQRLMVRTSDQRIGQTAFICRPQTPFTREWWRRLNEILDERADDLAHRPGRLNRSEDPYALGFTEILAQIIDPLAVKYHRRILYDDTIRFDERVPLPVTPSAVCIASGGDAIRFRSYINQAIYARERGFSYHLGIGLSRGARSPYEPKFVVIEEMLPHFEWVVWMDDDVYVTDMAAPVLERLLEDAERDDKFLVLAEGPLEPHGGWTTINTGVMALRNDPRTWELLRDARTLDLGWLRTRWDAGRFGAFTNGDQDTVCWAMHAKPHLLRGSMIVGHRLLNSRPHYYEHALADAFAVHFCGAGDKMLRAAEFARRFGLGQELVEEVLLTRWSTQSRGRMSALQCFRRKISEQVAEIRARLVRKIRFIRETGTWK